LKKENSRPVQAGSDVRSVILLLLVASAVRIDAGDDQVSAARLDVARLEKTVQEHPDNAFARYQLGLAYRELSDNRSATINLQAAIHGGFDNLGARLNLVEAAFACRQSTLALETAEQILSSPVKSIDVLLRVGRVLFEHLFYKEALHAFQLAQALAPNEFEPRFRLALTDYLLEDYTDALATLRPAGTPLLPPTPEAASLEASAEAEAGHIEPAISLLRTTIETSPRSPHAYVNLALIDLDRGNASEAEALLEQLRSLSPPVDAKVFYRVRRNSCPELAKLAGPGARQEPLSRDKGEFYYQLARQLGQGFNFLSSVELIRLAQATEGNSARVLLVAGKSCLNQDPSAPEAVTLLRAAIVQNSNLHEAYYLLGRAYAHRGRVEEAIKTYRRALELHPDASYYVSLGKVLRNRQSAIVEFQNALTLDSSYAQAHLELGRAWIDLGEFDKARPELEKAIELEPDFYEADYLLGRLLHRLGNEEQSRRMLKLFAENKAVLMQQSVIQAGYVGEGH
jgi:tetratricopeptide (TPR) repeat protein